MSAAKNIVEILCFSVFFYYLLYYLRKVVSMPKTQADNVPTNPKELCPLRNCCVKPVTRKPKSGSEVISLLQRGSPSTVGFIVAKFVVYTIYRLTIRSFTHVRVKSREAVLPLFTDCDASTTPKVILRVFGVVASILNPCVNSICSSFAHTVCLVNNFSAFFVEATTGFCMPIIKLCGVHNNFVATHTQAKPPATGVSSSAINRWRLRNDFKPTKIFTNQIGEPSHEFNL